MKILAVDQGTSATKAVVFGDDGETLASVEVAVTPHAVPGGGVEQDPEQLWDSVCAAGRDAIARAGGSVTAVGVANQGETVLAWDRGTGRPLSAAISWQDRRAADGLRGHGGRRRTADADDRSPARSLLRGAEDDVAAPQRHDGRGRDDHRHLAPAPPHGRLRHRRHHRLEDAAPRPRAPRLVGGGLRGLRAALPGPPRRRRLRGGDRPDGRVRGAARRQRFERRPAGGAGRGALPRNGASRSARTAPARSCWPTRARSRRPRRPAWPCRWPGSSASTPPTASTGRSTPRVRPSPGCAAGGSWPVPRISTPLAARWATAAASRSCPPSAASARRGGDPMRWPASRGSGRAPSPRTSSGRPSRAWRRR